MKRLKCLTYLLLCGLITTALCVKLVIPATAEEECTCEVTVHGSNCPMSECICKAENNGQHQENCPLYMMSEDLTACICQIETHAQGCPRYEKEDLNSENNGDAVTDEADLTENASSSDSASVSENADEPNEPEDNASDTSVHKKDADNSQGDGDNAESENESEDEDTADNEESAENTPDQTHNKPEIEEPKELEPAVAEYFALLNDELSTHIQRVKNAVGIQNCRVVQDSANLSDILAVYAVMTEQTENYPYSVKADTKEQIDLLYSVYWSMTQVTGVSNSDGAMISVKRLSTEKGAEINGLNDAQKQTASNFAKETSDIINNLIQ